MRERLNRVRPNVPAIQMSPMAGKQRDHGTTKNRFRMASSSVDRDSSTDHESSIDAGAQAIQTALEAMDPPIEVFWGVVRLIAEFAQFRGECFGIPSQSFVQSFAAV